MLAALVLFRFSFVQLVAHRIYSRQPDDFFLAGIISVEIAKTVAVRIPQKKEHVSLLRPRDLSGRGPPDEGTREELFKRPIPGSSQRRGEKEIDEQSSHADNSL